MNAEIKIGKEVWYSMPYVDVKSGVITEEKHPEYTDYVKVKGTRETYGTQWVDRNKCYPTKQALLDALRTESENRTAQMKKSIHTVGDLVSFMYDNQISGEYADWDAKRAAAAAAKELLGIELDR